MTYTHICADFLSSYLAPCERPPSGGRSRPHFSLREGFRRGVTKCRTVRTYTRRAEIISPVDDSRLKATEQPPDGPRTDPPATAKRRGEVRIGGASEQCRGVAFRPYGADNERTAPAATFATRFLWSAGGEALLQDTRRRFQREAQHASGVPKRSGTTDESAAVPTGRQAEIGTRPSRRTTSDHARRPRPDSGSTTCHRDISSVSAMLQARAFQRSCPSTSRAAVRDVIAAYPWPQCRYRIVAGHP